MHTDVAKYLEFKAVDGSYVMTAKGKVHKVPATDGEAIKSSLMGMSEKRRARSFFIYVQDYEEDDPKARPPPPPCPHNPKNRTPRAPGGASLPGVPQVHDAGT